jgi:hypothetical protein
MDTNDTRMMSKLVSRIDALALNQARCTANGGVITGLVDHTY